MSAKDAVYPHIAFDQLGNATIAWGNGGHVLCARCEAATDTCTSPEQLDDLPHGGAGLADVAVASNGDVVAIWTKSNPKIYRQVWARHYRVASDSWAPPVQIGSGTASSAIVRAPQVLIDRAGRATAIWTQQAPDESLSIWVNRYD